jgi:cytochrome P450
MDPPLHSRIRELVARAFTPNAVVRFEQDIRNHVDSLLTPIVESGGGEIVDPFATPVSIGAIASLIGLPVTETDQLKDWSLDLANYFGRVARRAVGAPGDEQGFLEFLAFLKSLLDRAANTPDENIVGNLARLCRSGSLTEREATHFLAVLFNAGQDTMTILIANAFLTLAEQPALLARMRHAPADVPRFTEELARFRAAPQRLSRIAVEDCEVAGCFIPAGAEIRLLPGSANRDAAKFPDGERFDIDRDTRGHLGFGYGIHTCLGAWLARLEMRAVLGLVAQKVGAVELDPTVPILYYEGGTMSNAGPRQMTVRLYGR